MPLSQSGHQWVVGSPRDTHVADMLLLALLLALPDANSFESRRAALLSEPRERVDGAAAAPAPAPARPWSSTASSFESRRAACVIEPLERRPGELPGELGPPRVRSLR